MDLINNLTTLLERGQDTALLRFGLGQALFGAGRAAEAVPHLQQAVSHDPRYSAAWKLLGKALAETGRRNEALEAYAIGIAVAEARGDKQAAKEMQVFMKRLETPAK